MRCIGIARKDFTEDTILDFVNDTCEKNGITSINISFSSDFVTRKLMIDKKTYDFIELIVDNDQAVVKRLINGILARGMPCYHGNFYYPTVYPTVQKKGVLLHVPGQQGKKSGGIAVIESYYDMSCGVEFPTRSFMDTEPVIKYVPIGIELPTTYAVFIKKIEEMIKANGLSTDRRNAFCREHAIKLATACNVYTPKIIWLHEMPDDIKAISKKISVNKEFNAIHLLGKKNAEWLGIDDLYTESENESPGDMNVIDALGNLMTPDATMEFARTVAYFLHSFGDSKYKGKKIDIHTTKNKIILEMNESSPGIAEEEGDIDFNMVDGKPDETDQFDIEFDDEI